MPVQWSSASVYLPAGSWHTLLHHFLKQELDTMRESKAIRSFYVNLSSWRGQHIVVFLESYEQGNLHHFLSARLMPFLDRLTVPAQQAVQQEGHHLFVDVDDKEVFHNLVKMKADPFLCLSEEQRQVYYGILQCLSGYLLSLDKAGYQALLENRFLLCLLTGLSILKNRLFVKNAAAISGWIVAAELADAESKLNRSLEPGLSASFRSKKESLLALYRYPEQLPALSGQAFPGQEYPRVLTAIDSLLTNPGLFTDSAQQKIFIRSLLADISEIFDFQQSLTCNYFIKSVLTNVSL